MSDHGLTARILQGSSPLEALMSHELYLRPRRDDEDVRRQLRSGEAAVGGAVLHGGPTGIWDQIAAEDRKVGLAVNSLRFLDALRRDGAQPGYRDLWLHYVRGWQEWAPTAREAGLDSFLPASQRAVVLAAGLSSLWPSPQERPSEIVELLGEHRSVFTEKLRTGRVHLVEEAVIRGAASMSCGPRPSTDAAAVLAEFVARYIGSGLAPGGGIGAVTETTRRWVDLYQSIHDMLDDDADELEEPAELRERSESALSVLWTHGTLPTGSLLPSGSLGAQASWDDRSPRTSAERYAASASDEGEAADELVHVDPSGWAFVRRGWGETELDFDQETFFSLRSGRLESPGRDHDNSALWLTARGVTWFADRPGAEGSEWQDRSHHSCVDVDARYRTLSDAEVTRERVTADCVDLEVRDRAFLPVALTRRVVYSRSGDFLVVVDQVRSADAHTGRQHWIIPPGCAVEVSEGHAVITRGPESCRLIWLNVPAVLPSVAELGDGWQRIAVPFSAASTRLITAVVPAPAQESIDCRRTPMEDGAISVSLRRPRHAEQLIITKEGAGVGPVDEDSAELSQRVTRNALNGGITPEEEDALRQQIRAQIAEVKQRIRSEGGGTQLRSEALEDLLEIARDHQVEGLRDFGLGAALIDVAGADLRPRIAAHHLVNGRKRSPLISWDDQSPLDHDFYAVPIRTRSEVCAELDTDLTRQMLTIDTGQLVLPFLLSTVSSGRTLSVMFHGATDRSRNALPRFERMRSMEGGSSGPVLFVSDPCLDLDASQILTWYAGDEQLNLHRLIARQAKAYADALGCDRILFVGNSGGGFAALQCASYSTRSAVVTFNPQIQVDRYVPRIARTAQEVLFGRESVADDPELRARMDLIERYREIGFAKRVFFIQNTGDEMHYESHCKPFSEAWAAEGELSDLGLVTPYLGAGHRVPPPDEYMALVREGEAFVFSD